jgi:hypothetical protein
LLFSKISRTTLGCTHPFLSGWREIFMG